MTDLLRLTFIGLLFYALYVLAAELSTTLAIAFEPINAALVP